MADSNPFELIRQLQGIVSKMPEGWWSQIEPTRHDNSWHLYNEMVTDLTIRASKNNATVYTNGAARILKGKLDELVNDLISDKMGFSILLKSLTTEDIYVRVRRRQSPNPVYVLKGKDNGAVLRVELTPKKNQTRIAIEAASLDCDVLKKVMSLVELYSEDCVDDSDLYIISDNFGELELAPIGRPAVPLVKENYSEKVVEEFLSVANDFIGPNPKGRLAILHGQSGSGKTYLLKAFIGMCNPLSTKIVFFPPEIFASINSPSISKLLIDNSVADQSMVLLIEDGDGVLLRREIDNMNVIASLLSLSDGFLGSMLDIRIFITTNTKKPDIDEALLRDGRLNKIIEVGKLSREQAAKAYFNLTGKNYTFNDAVTLAQVYNMVQT